MMRSTFFAGGLFLALWGVSFLFIDQIVLSFQEEPTRTANFRGLFTATNRPQQKTIDPPDWAAFSMISIGAVTMMYAVALPKKNPAG